MKKTTFSISRLQTLRSCLKFQRSIHKGILNNFLPTGAQNYQRIVRPFMIKISSSISIFWTLGPQICLCLFLSRDLKHQLDNLRMPHSLQLPIPTKERPASMIRSNPRKSIRQLLKKIRKISLSWII
jgi:hypothetical protein